MPEETGDTCFTPDVSYRFQEVWWPVIALVTFLVVHLESANA